VRTSARGPKGRAEGKTRSLGALIKKLGRMRIMKIIRKIWGWHSMPKVETVKFFDCSKWGNREKKPTGEETGSKSQAGERSVKLNQYFRKRGWGSGTHTRETKKEGKRVACLLTHRRLRGKGRHLSPKEGASVGTEEMRTLRLNNGT